MEAKIQGQVKKALSLPSFAIGRSVAAVVHVVNHCAQVSLINFVASLCGLGGIQAFKTMRTLRALRPLRAMSRMQGMRVSATEPYMCVAMCLLSCAQIGVFDKLRRFLMWSRGHSSVQNHANVASSPST